MRHALIGRLLAASLAFGALTPAAQAAPDPASQTAPEKVPSGVWRHAVTLMGEPKYGADFKHFDYADPAAPKGGLVRLGHRGLRQLQHRRGGPQGRPRERYRADLRYPDDRVGRRAVLLLRPHRRGLRLADDLSAVTYRLREGARWHDGQPITPEDVVWSFTVQKENSPSLARYYHTVTKAEVTGPREVTFTFAEAGNRELPQVIGQLRVLPKHWWTGQDAQGRPRDVTQTTLEIPLGSGPYRLAKFERAAAPPTSAWPITGARIYRSTSVAIISARCGSSISATPPCRSKPEGRSLRLPRENIARNWATAYDDFPAVKEGRLVKRSSPIAATATCRLRLQHPPSEVRRSAACAGPSTSP